MHLLIEIPSKDGPAFRECLPLLDATLVKGRSMMKRGWGDPVDTPAESAMLKWDLHTTNIDGLLGACYLWGPGERMCQITPPAGKKELRQARNEGYAEDGHEDAFGCIYGEPENNPGLVYDESAICDW